MNINDYCNLNNDELGFSRMQASNFAKNVAGDFNPIHDLESRRFCVPGDLLFTIVLHRYGVSQEMAFEFAGMVGDSSELILPTDVAGSYSLTDKKDKEYMHVVTSGEISRNPVFIDTLTQKYVQFSGQTFPHILVPLMEEKNVMINPERPLVIYKSMSLHLDSFTPGAMTLDLTNANLEVKGKKGEVSLDFSISVAGNIIGNGTKNMLLSGLRTYDQKQVEDIVETYDKWKNNWHSRTQN